MAKILTHKEQYELMVRLSRVINNSPSETDRFLYICSYAAIVGKISQRTFFNLMRYANVNTEKKKFVELLRLYLSLGMIRFTDDGSVVYRDAVKKASRQKFTNNEIMQIKSIIDRVRDRLMEE